MTNVYLSNLKPVRFGRPASGSCVKAGLYIPHWPSQALAARLRRSLRSREVHHEQVTLSVTDECPYRCPHCFNARRPSEPMPLSRLQELVGEIQEIGGSFLNIGGGEPGVAMDRTLATIEAADGRSEIWLNTTGFNIDADTARSLTGAGLFGVRVSIHFATASAHDEFVGYPNAFDTAVACIGHFKAAGAFPVMTTAMPLARFTRNDVLAMMRLGKELGVGIVEILPIRPAGRAFVACDHSELVAHGGEDVGSIVAEFNGSRQYAAYPNLNTPAYFEASERFGCVAGTERLFISASGDVQPCPLVNLSVGNVVREDFCAINDRMRSLLPRPRREPLCARLYPAVQDYVSQCPEGIRLPVDEQRSLELLEALPYSPLPDAYA
jgi:MoaA/NifB/PqqE/SkfB family radical SAM enzyme